MGVTEDEMVGWHTDSMDMSLNKLWKIVKDREAWRAAVHGVGHNLVTKQQQGLGEELLFYREWISATLLGDVKLRSV